ncbi:MAG: GNAT family N-acetyltransferase [Draconibacterium sp.]
MGIVIHAIDKVFLAQNLSRFIDILKSEPDEYWDESNFLYELPNKYNLSLAACLGKELVGYIIASSKENRTSHIHKFMVDKNYRGKQIGQKLYDRFEIVAKSLLMEAVSLNVYSENERAINFYTKNGLQIDSRRKDTTSGRELILLTKNM